MRVRIKTWLPALFGFFAVMAVADTAAAQCGSGCEPPPPPCCAPPPPPPPPPVPCCTPPPPPTPCCGGGNVNVNVNVNAAANANASASARSAINARAGSTVYVGGGGSAYVHVDQPYPTAIQGLNVEGARVAQLIRVPFTATRSIRKQVVIRAVCIDDRNVPHPASQVRPGRDVREDYEGELYRCIAGSRLQMSIADWDGQAEFDGGETLMCRKREALWHGGGGRIECRPEKPERDCNERSLLRRYGAGLKVLTLSREETYTEYREEMVETQGVAVAGASMVLDGGVGGRVF